jgi:hypothetical protein
MKQQTATSICMVTNMVIIISSASDVSIWGANLATFLQKGVGRAEKKVGRALFLTFRTGIGCILCCCVCQKVMELLVV